MMSLSHPITRLALAAAFVTVSAAPLLHAQDRTETTTPSAPVSQPQYSTITSTNNVVQLTRVPVTYNGKLYYEDVNLTFDFTVDPAVSGKPAEVTVSVKPEAAPSVTPITSNFKAGTYIGPADVNGDKSIIVIAGPSALPGGGSQWTLTTGSSASTSTYPSTSTWYDESLSANPLDSRIKAAKITSTQYSYGTGDSGSSPNGEWPNNALLGYSQVGNTLTISSFTYQNGCCGTADSPTPVDQITYTLEQ